MADLALKEEVFDYINKMDNHNLGRVLNYVKEISRTPKSPYGKFKTAEEYAEAQKLWEELQELCQPTETPIPPDVDLIKEGRAAYWRRKYESIS